MKGMGTVGATDYALHIAFVRFPVSIHDGQTQNLHIISTCGQADRTETSLTAANTNAVPVAAPERNLLAAELYPLPSISVAISALRKGFAGEERARHKQSDQQANRFIAHRCSP